VQLYTATACRNGCHVKKAINRTRATCVLLHVADFIKIQQSDKKKLVEVINTGYRKLYVCSLGRYNLLCLCLFFFHCCFIPLIRAITNKSASQLYGSRDWRLSAKLVPTFSDRGVSHSQRGRHPTAVTAVF
jgi:hypothetical protein